MNKNKKEILILSIGIALLPPLWAVLAPYIGISTGAVALICAGLYVTNGNKLKDGLKIMCGFMGSVGHFYYGILEMESKLRVIFNT